MAGVSAKPQKARGGGGQTCWDVEGTGSPVGPVRVSPGHEPADGIADNLLPAFALSKDLRASAKVTMGQ